MKAGKMFGREVVLPTCPKCGQPAVAPEMHACLACDWKDPAVWKPVDTTLAELQKTYQK